MKPLSLSRNLPGILNPVFPFLSGILSSVLALSKLNYPLTGIDDANIYFVYARNLANGYGFVYNVGGERVEGFTSLLWTLICALAYKFSSHFEFTLLIINILLVTLGITGAVHYLQHTLRTGEGPQAASILWPILYVLLIFSSARYVAWNTITLMENALWSTLLLLTTLFVIRPHLSPKTIYSQFTPLVILLLLTRPESNLWVLLFMAVLFLRLSWQSNKIYAVRILAPSAISAGFALAVLTLFRLSYFGYPFPNTYYAKVSPLFTYNLREGASYLATYVISDPIVTLCIIAILVAIVRSLPVFFSIHPPVEGSFFLPFIAGVGLLSPLLVGGDHFGSFRVYQNIYPIELLALLVFLRQMQGEYFISGMRFKTSSRNAGFLSATLLLGLTLGIFQSTYSLWNSIESEIGIEFRFADYGRRNGAYLQDTFSRLPKLPSLGVVTSGGIKYTYSGEVIDLMGLNNTTMAHNQGDRVGIKDHAAFDIPTFYQLQPDVVWPATVDASTWQYSERELKESWENAQGLKGLFDEARFQELYTYAKVSSTTEQKYVIVGWFQNDLLQSIRANSDFQVEEYDYDVTEFSAPTKTSTIFSILISSFTIR